MTISTPPSTTLSTPSPTERTNPVGSEPQMARPIYLIVATTRCSSGKLGIGSKGGLPWPMIKGDMGFFQKVTRDSRPAGAVGGGRARDGRMEGEGMMNAVVMGRKTYESIPAKFRPLAGRMNVVVSRSKPKELAERIEGELRREKEKGSVKVDVKSEQLTSEVGGENVRLLSKTEGSGDGAKTIEIAPVLVSSSVPDALTALTGSATDVENSRANEVEQKIVKTIGNIFVIGGAEIYGSFLDQAQSAATSTNTRPIRILQTEVRKIDGSEFECDTFLPVQPEAERNAWRNVGREEVKTWLMRDDDREHAIPLPQGEDEWMRDEKVGVEIRVLGWEKE